MIAITQPLLFLQIFLVFYLLLEGVSGDVGVATGSRERVLAQRRGLGGTKNSFFPDFSPSIFWHLGFESENLNFKFKFDHLGEVPGAARSAESDGVLLSRRRGRWACQTLV